MERPEHQLAEEEHVALAADGEVRHGGPVDRAAQHRLEELGDRPGVEPDELEPLDDTVLPQGRHRLGRHLAGAEGGQDEGRVAPGQLVDERGRGVVEQVGVVDHEGEAPALGPFEERRRRPAEQVGPVVDASRLTVVGGREQRGEGPEREGGGRSGGGHPGGAHAGRLGQPKGLQGEPGFPDPGRAGDHHPGRVGPGDEIVQPVQLGGASDERPVLGAFPPHVDSLSHRRGVFAGRGALL